MTVKTTQNQPLTIGSPGVEDGPGLWELIVGAGVLDRNSLYAYLLLCDHFSRTCMVAKEENRVVAAVTGYVLPKRPDTLFIWQIAVDENQRGKGLASQMLNRLLCQCVERGIRFIETTISPSNKPSDGLFRKLAARWQTDLTMGTGYSESLFPFDQHESEPLYRLGPFNISNFDAEGEISQ